MRTTAETVAVRLYRLDEEAAPTLFYGPLHEALMVARAQPAEVQEALFIATDNDVIAFLDLEES